MNFSLASNSELVLMNVIWDKNAPITASEIVEGANCEWDNITVLTFLTRLCKKGLLKKERDTVDRRSNIYSAIVSREDYGAMISQFMYEKVHCRSDSSFIAALFKSNTLSADSLKEIRRIVEAQEYNKK